MMEPAAGIAGVEIVPLQRIPDERGTIYHMLRSTDHREMTLNYACISGRIKLVLYDDRPDSPTNGTLLERFLGPDDYSLVAIPPGVWSGFKGMAEESLVANCATHPHDPSRTERIDPFGDRIRYDWGVRHR